MSRFGTAGLFYYAPGDTLASGTTVSLNVQDMPQFPVETKKLNDAESYRSIGGRKYEYLNWSKNEHTFNWVDLRGTMRDQLFTMVNSLPILTFLTPTVSGYSTLGTFRAVPGSWNDSETSNDRFDVSFSIEEV